MMTFSGSTRRQLGRGLAEAFQGDGYYTVHTHSRLYKTYIHIIRLYDHSRPRCPTDMCGWSVAAIKSAVSVFISKYGIIFFGFTRSHKNRHRTACAARRHNGRNAILFVFQRTENGCAYNII